jgi:hypothetical protein
MKARRALVGALALAVAVPAGCSDDGPGEGEARLEVEGRAVVERDGDEQEVVDGGTNVGPGDRIEVTDGVATMAMRGGSRLELRAGRGDAGDSVLLMGEVPVLEAGDLLVSSPASTDVESAGTTLTIEEGAAQVTRAHGVAVAAYEGTVNLDSAGQERTVPALRQMLVPRLGRPPQAPRPLAYDEDDPWDRRFLGAAIDVGDRLDALATGYTRNLRDGEGRTPGFFRLVLPGLDDEPDFGAELIRLDRPPGETLIGAAITDLGRRGDFVDRWESVFRFRDEGAHWGLVALDQDVSGTPLLGAIEQAVSSSPLAFVEPIRRSPVITTPPTPPSTEPEPPPTTEPPPPTTEPPPPTDPPILEPFEPFTPALEPVVDPLQEVVEGLVAGLLGLLTPPPGG